MGREEDEWKMKMKPISIFLKVVREASIWIYIRAAKEFEKEDKKPSDEDFEHRCAQFKEKKKKKKQNYCTRQREKSPRVENRFVCLFVLFVVM